MKQSFKSEHRKTISLVGALLIALMVVGGSYKSWCNQNINLSFNATNTEDVTYRLYYTTDVKENFSAKKSTAKSVKSGTHRVKIVIPAENVAKIRLNIGNRPGTVNISKLKLNGHASVDLSDFSDHEYINIDEEEILPDGSITLISEQDNPYIGIRTMFNMHKGYDLDLIKIGLFFGSVFLIFYAFFTLALYEKKKKKKDPIDYY